MRKKEKKIVQNKYAVTSILELVIAAAIIFIILVFFFISINNFFTAYDRSDIDLQEKVLDICQNLMYSPGESTYITSNWENDPQNTTMLGLSASPLVSYGAFNLTTQGEIENVSSFTPRGDLTGLTRSCFLSGTKVIMSDGSFKNIEDVKIGDLVKSFDATTRTIMKKSVTKVFHHPSTEMGEYYLIINHRLKVTPDHLLYVDNTWRPFSSIRIGDIVDSVKISSIEKVYDKVPTYNLEIEGNHNFFIYFFDDSFLVHNDPQKIQDISNIDWRPWLPVSKNPLPDTYGLESYGGNYFIEYTVLPSDPKYFLYEIKEKNDYPYPVLDAQKCLSLSNNELPYYLARSVFGLDESQYVDYDLNISISNETGTLYTYGPTCIVPYVKATVTRDVLIYYKPNLLSGDIYDIQPPYYQKGEISLRLFLAARILYPSGSTPPPEDQPPERPTIKNDGPHSGKVLSTYFYNTSTTDPEGDPIFFKWNWGDGTQSTWLGPYFNNTYNQQSHSWTTAGTFYVKVKARDLGGKESDWSDSYPVTIYYGTYYKRIMIQKQQVIDTQSYFPVFIYNISDNDLRTHALPSGRDIVFTDSNGNKLPFEIENYTGGTGFLNAWVRVPEINNISDTILYMYYGNANLASQQDTTGAVWESNYHGVWHMNQSSGFLRDSTSYLDSGSIVSNPPGPYYDQPGKIAGAMRFDGTGDYVNFGDPVSGCLDFGANDFTIECWMKTTSTNNNYTIAKIEYGGSGPSHGSKINGYAIGINLKTAGSRKFNAVLVYDGTTHVLSDSTAQVTNGVWHYIGVTYDRDGKATYYIDGIKDSEQSISAWFGPISNTNSFEFARNHSTKPGYYNGLIDEVRISSGLRSYGWIKTEYRNINDPTSFLKFGPQQTI